MPFFSAQIDTPTGTFTVSCQVHREVRQSWHYPGEPAYWEIYDIRDEHGREVEDIGMDEEELTERLQFAFEEWGRE